MLINVYFDANFKIFFDWMGPPRIRSAEMTFLLTILFILYILSLHRNREFQLIMLFCNNISI